MRRARHAFPLPPRLALAVASCICFVACGPPPAPGTVVTYDDFCDPKYDLPEGALADTPRPRMTIEGYLQPPKMFVMCSDTCSFDLSENQDGSGRSIRYSVRLGGGHSQIEPLPDNFKAADFKLHTNTDAVLGLGDKARVTGQRLGSSKDNSCQLYKVDLVQVP